MKRKPHRKISAPRCWLIILWISSLQTEILYLPRTTSRYSRPFIPEPDNEKRPCISASEWHAFTAEGVGSTGDNVELFLPRELHYPSGQAIPFLLSSTSSGKYEFVIELVRISHVRTRAGVVRQSDVVAQGRIHGLYQSGPRRMVQGVLEMGEVGRELSWSFVSLVSVNVSLLCPFRYPVPIKTHWLI
jgi:hypothetical protein